MASPHLDEDLAASAVALSGLYGVKRAAAKLGIHVQSVKRYRQLMLQRPELRAKVEEKRKALEGDWAHRLPGAIRNSIDFLERASDDADTKDPSAIHAVAGALKILTEVAMSRRFLDARLKDHAGVSRPMDAARSPDRPGDGAAEGDPAASAH